MNALQHLIKDPVCEMMVTPGVIGAVHEGVSYTFCSEQCQERFAARPGLYVGAHGRPAPKQRGEKLLRQRCVRLCYPLTDLQAKALIEALREMMGVLEVRYVEQRIDRRDDSRPPAAARASRPVGAIEIRYDLMEATLAQFERRIARSGGVLGNGVGEKLRRDFVRYLEECELDDIESIGAIREVPGKRERAVTRWIICS